ncbi:hypothetical protein [Sphingomonas oligophenolica]|uniref:hypothetical protein n=1 Tax=Sphingomonas oligophenolica TaxID=301154 RepID=UPI00112702A6|nr:hypothetical protein [Sphingomonas oligophenolica]
MITDDWGDPVIAEGSFHRRIPAGLAPESRIAMDAIILCADIVTCDWRRLQHGLLTIGMETEGITPLQRADLWGAAWNIVDQIHLAREIARRISSSPPGPATQAFLNDTKVTTLVRNCMDHIPEMLPQHGISKKQTPIFGVLNWFFWPNPPEYPYFGFSMSAGSSASTRSWIVKPPSDEWLRSPLHGISLQSFDHEILLDRLVRTFRIWIAACDPSLEEQVLSQLAEYAERSGESFEALIAAIDQPPLIKMEITPSEEGEPRN